MGAGRALRPATGEYLLHFSASNAADDYRSKCIWVSRTKDFSHFSAPEKWFSREGGDVIDSAAYEEDERYYLFVKSVHDPFGVMLLRSDSAAGPWERVKAFEESTLADQGEKYEGPTALRLPDGRWVLFMDFFGVFGRGQGYVPFVADSLASGVFRRSDADFSFPYKFKHGTVLPISEEEYERLRRAEWKVD